MDLILNPSDNRCLHKPETCSMFQGGYGSHIFSFHIVIGPEKKKVPKETDGPDARWCLRRGDRTTLVTFDPRT